MPDTRTFASGSTGAGYDESQTNRNSRRSFLQKAGAAGLGIAAAGLLGQKPASAAITSHDDYVITAATTAEALATTMYYNIISSSIYSSDLSGNTNDQAYLVAGFEQELDHYNLLVNAGGSSLASTFYFPTGMFSDQQTTVNTLVTLEDAFICAYLHGVRSFSTVALRELAAQIMGIEAEHRVLARVITADLGLQYSVGLSGNQEYVNGPDHAANNIAYERTFSPPLVDIKDVVKALGPFVTLGASGFSTTPYPFQNTLPTGITAVQLDSQSPSS